MTAPLRQWDVVKVRIHPEDRDHHPAIVLSPAEIVASTHVDRVNVIYGSTKRPGRELLPGQVLLDEADGCERLTVFDCLLFPVVKKAAIVERLGAVSPARRRNLHQTIASALRLFHP